MQIDRIKDHVDQVLGQLDAAQREKTLNLIMEIEGFLSKKSHVSVVVIGALLCVADAGIKVCTPSAEDAEKIKRIKAHFDKERAESPDGLTSWERVEKYRKEHGGELPS